MKFLLNYASMTPVSPYSFSAIMLLACVFLYLVGVHTTHVGTLIHMHTHIQAHTQTYIPTFTLMLMHTHTHTYMHTHTHTILLYFVTHDFYGFL